MLSFRASSFTLYFIDVNDTKRILRVLHLERKKKTGGKFNRCKLIQYSGYSPPISIGDTFTAVLLGIAALADAIMRGKETFSNELKNAICGAQEHKTRPK